MRTRQAAFSFRLRGTCLDWFRGAVNRDFFERGQNASLLHTEATAFRRRKMAASGRPSPASSKVAGSGTPGGGAVGTGTVVGMMLLSVTPLVVPVLAVNH